MTHLRIVSRVPQTSPHQVLLELEGAFDQSASALFREIWNGLPGSSLKVLILNFRRVTTLNDFGAGFVAGLLEALGRSDCEIRLVQVPASIRQALLDISPPVSNLRFYASEAEASVPELPPLNRPYLHHFRLSADTPEVGSGVPFLLRVEAQDADDRLVPDYQGTPHLMADRGMLSPTLLGPFTGGVWEGPTILTGPGEVRVRAWDSTGLGELTLRVTEEGADAVFPQEVLCPGCSRANVAGKSDIFRCVKCNHIYFVDPRGRVVPLKAGRTNGYVKQLEFRIPSDINYLNHVRNFIVGITREEQVDEAKISQIEMSLDEALANVVEHAYIFDAHQDIQVRVDLYPDRLEIVIRDHGRSFDSDHTPLPNIKEHIEQRRVGGLGRYLMKTLMDEVEYQSDSFTNELRMTKRF